MLHTLLDANARPSSGERPENGKRGGLRRVLQFLAAGAGLAVVALLGARFVLSARRPQNETPLESARRELRDLRRRIEVRVSPAVLDINGLEKSTLGFLRCNA